MRNQFPTLYTKRLILRFASLEDATEIVKYYAKNKEYLQSWEPIRPESFYTDNFWNKQVLKNIEEYKQDRSCRFFIFPKETSHQVIGTANFSNFVRGVAQYCNLGYSLDEDYQGKALMTEALEMALEFTFYELNMHRIMANYIPHNRKSGNVLKRLGFAVEGYYRDYLLINGKWEDHVMTSLINPDWQSKK